MNKTLHIIDGETKRELGCATFTWIPDAEFDVLNIDGSQFIAVGHGRNTLVVRQLDGEVPKHIRILWQVRLSENKPKPAIPRFRSECQAGEFISPPRLPVKRNQWRPKKWPEIESELGA